MNIFYNTDQDYSLTLTNVSHNLTVSNNQVYSNDEFDLWLIYSGERLIYSCEQFRPHGPLVFLFYYFISCLFLYDIYGNILGYRETFMLLRF